jgi:hypothetical protein
MVPFLRLLAWAKAGANGADPRQTPKECHPALKAQ